MKNDNLANALLQGQPSPDPGALTAAVLRRDRRRILLVGIACVIAWMAVVMLPWATVLPLLAKLIEHRNDTPADTLIAHTHTVIVITFLLSLSTMFIAAVSTISFVFLTRRATLRQISAQLAQLSAQLESPARH